MKNLILWVCRECLRGLGTTVGFSLSQYWLFQSTFSIQKTEKCYEVNSIFGKVRFDQNFLQNSKIKKLETLLVYQSQDFTKNFCKKLTDDEDEFTIKG